MKISLFCSQAKKYHKIFKNTMNEAYKPTSGQMIFERALVKKTITKNYRVSADPSIFNLHKLNALFEVKTTKTNKTKLEN